MAYDRELADRIREALSGERNVREVAMFGGLAFMVDEQLAVSANRDGDLMVRCDPDRTDELLARPGAGRPTMRGRLMSRGWIVVDSSGIDSDEDLASWIGEALAGRRKGR